MENDWKTDLQHIFIPKKTNNNAQILHTYVYLPKIAIGLRCVNRMDGVYVLVIARTLTEGFRLNHLPAFLLHWILFYNPMHIWHLPFVLNKMCEVSREREHRTSSSLWFTNYRAWMRKEISSSTTKSKSMHIACMHYIKKNMPCNIWNTEQHTIYSAKKKSVKRKKKKKKNPFSRTISAEVSCLNLLNKTNSVTEKFFNQRKRFHIFVCGVCFFFSLSLHPLHYVWCRASRNKKKVNERAPLVKWTCFRCKGRCIKVA